MMEYLIRNFRPEDDNTIEEITYRTGYLGEDLTGKDYIDDKRLLYLIFQNIVSSQKTSPAEKSSGSFVEHQILKCKKKDLDN
jgi:hypothetical protein